MAKRKRFEGYLASPYSHPDPAVSEARYVKALRAMGWALKNNLWLYSPIAHIHPIAVYCDLPKGFDFWEEYDEHGIGSCRAFYILRIPGWAESAGVNREIEIAHGLAMPFFFMFPDDDQYRCVRTSYHMAKLAALKEIERGQEAGDNAGDSIHGTAL